MIRFLLAFVGLSLFILLKGNAQSGTLVSSFGNSGVLEIPAISEDMDAVFYSGQVLGESLFMIGYSQDEGFKRQLVIVKSDLDGNLDMDFGDAGIMFPVPEGYSRSTGLLSSLAHGDQLLVAGVATNGNGAELILFKMDEEGKIDESFGENGFFTTERRVLGNDEVEPRSLVFDANNNILLTGRFYNGQNDDFFVTRVLESGITDSTFATDGLFLHEFEDVNSYETGRGIDVSQDGSIFVGGEHDDDQFVIKLTSDGMFDNSFGNDGISITSFGDDVMGDIFSLQIKDNQVFTAGKYRNSETSQRNLYLSRSSLDGAIDLSFGDNGILLVEGDNVNIDNVYLMEGRSVFICGNKGGFPGEFMVGKFDVDGNIDNNYGENGLFTFSHVTGFSNVYGLAFTNNSTFALGSSSDGFDALLLTALKLNGGFLTSYKENQQFAFPINVYPNPSFNSFQIDLPTNMDNVRVGILNNNGQLVNQIIDYRSGQEISSNLSTGTYNILVESGNNKSVIRLMVTDK